MQGLLDSPWKNHTIIRDWGGKKTLSGSCHSHFFKSFAVCHRTIVLCKTQTARRTVSIAAGTFCLLAYTFRENGISLLIGSSCWKIPNATVFPPTPPPTEFPWPWPQPRSGCNGLIGILVGVSATLLDTSMGRSAASPSVEVCFWQRQQCRGGIGKKHLF